MKRFVVILLALSILLTACGTAPAAGYKAPVVFL